MYENTNGVCNINTNDKARRALQRNGCRNSGRRRLLKQLLNIVVSETKKQKGKKPG